MFVLHLYFVIHNDTLSVPTAYTCLTLFRRFGGPLEMRFSAFWGPARNAFFGVLGVRSKYNAESSPSNTRSIVPGWIKVFLSADKRVRPGSSESSQKLLDLDVPETSAGIEFRGGPGASR